jgi:hypothetical protein
MIHPFTLTAKCELFYTEIDGDVNTIYSFVVYGRKPKQAS